MNSESTSNSKEYNEWLDKLEKLDDLSVSREIHDRILSHSDIDKESLDLFDIAYEYCIKLINQGKNLEINLLKIYLQDVKGKDINQINMINLVALLGICGINLRRTN